MEQSNFYVLALYAERIIGRDSGEIERRLAAGAVSARTDDEAKREGVERLLARCPAEEGWTNHEVTVSVVLRDLLHEVLRDTDYEPDAPEIIM